MSTNKKDTQQTEKVMTKYDLKMQKRAEEKKKDAKRVAIWKFIGVAFVVLLIAFVLSFPARTIYNLKKTVVTIDGEKIGKVEFDYMYNTVKSNYMQQYSAYLSSGLKIKFAFSGSTSFNKVALTLSSSTIKFVYTS